MIPAGSLDRRLTILRRVKTGVDALNSPIFDFCEIRTVAAAKTQKAESETFQQDVVQRAALRTVTFTVRFMADLGETDRLRCDGLEYGIKGIREIGRRVGLEITAEVRL